MAERSATAELIQDGLECAGTGVKMFHLAKNCDALAARVAALEERAEPPSVRADEPLRGYGDAMDEEAREGGVGSSLRVDYLEAARVDLERVTKERDGVLATRDATLDDAPSVLERMAKERDKAQQMADALRHDLQGRDMHLIEYQRDLAAAQAKLEAIRDCVGRSYDAESLRELAAVTTGHKRIAAELTADLLDILDDKTPTDA